MQISSGGNDEFWNDANKRYLIAGILVGTTVVGLAILARRTPPDEWQPTLLRIGRDALSVARRRYGGNTVITLAEEALERLEKAQSDVTA